MHIVKVGWTVRAFRLDGTSVEGKVERLSERPCKWQQGDTETTVVLEDGSEHLTRLCEPAGETFKKWAEFAEPRPGAGCRVMHGGYLLHPHVHFDTIAYRVIDEILGGHWSAHLTEYVTIDWDNRTMKSNQLSEFVGSRAVYDKSGALVYDGGHGRMAAEDVLEKLAAVTWAYQDDQVERLQAAILPAFGLLEGLDVPVAYVHLPRWARMVWPGHLVYGAKFCDAPFPLVMSERHYGRFAPIRGIEP